MQSHGKDLKGQTLSFYARVGSTATAGSTGDNTEVTGDSIDITALSARPASVVFEIPVSAVLADTESIVVTGLIESSADNSTWETLVASATLLTMTSDGGTTEKGVARIGADLIQSDVNYIRFKATPNLSRANTDTAALGAAVAVFGGLQTT
jgi:hypothetical protein